MNDLWAIKIETDSRWFSPKGPTISVSGLTRAEAIKALETELAMDGHTMTTDEKFAANNTLGLFTMRRDRKNFTLSKV